MRSIRHVLDAELFELCANHPAKIDAWLVCSGAIYRTPRVTLGEQCIEVGFSGEVGAALLLYAVATGADAATSKERERGEIPIGSEHTNRALEQIGRGLGRFPERAKAEVHDDRALVNTIEEHTHGAIGVGKEHSVTCALDQDAICGGSRCEQLDIASSGERFEISGVDDVMREGDVHAQNARGARLLGRLAKFGARIRCSRGGVTMRDASHHPPDVPVKKVCKDQLRLPSSANSELRAQPLTITWMGAGELSSMTQISFEPAR